MCLKRWVSCVVCCSSPDLCPPLLPWLLHRALEDQYTWETRSRQAKELLNDMLKSRLEAQELAKQYDIKPVPKNAKVGGRHWVDDGRSRLSGCVQKWECAEQVGNSNGAREGCLLAGLA